MSGPVRNHRLAAGRLVANTPTNLYLPPAGFTAIVKFVGLSPVAAGTWGYQLGLYAVPEGAVVNLAYLPSTTDLVATWEGWTVLNAGDALFAQASLADAYYWVAGALLPLP